jgi:hypothetical protein
VTDLVDDLHGRVVLDLLDANNALNVFDGAVSKPYPAPPYVLVYTSIAYPAGEAGMGNALDHNSVTCVTTAYVHCVGSTAAACRALSMQVRASLLDAQPVIANRSCTRLEQDDAQMPVKDETIGSVVMDAVLVYSFTSVPG